MNVILKLATPRTIDSGSHELVLAPICKVD